MLAAPVSDLFRPMDRRYVAAAALVTHACRRDTLKDNGGYCDCEVMYNAADHFESNRD
jgi:hypothetical protein